MRESRAQAQVIVLDCCNAAAFREVKGRAQFQKNKSGILPLSSEEKPLQGKGKVLLYAAGGAEDALPDKTQRLLPQPRLSAFTKYLIQGLRTGEAGYGEYIDVNGWFLYASKWMKKDQAKQTPQMDDQMLEGSIIIAKKRPLYQSESVIEKHLFEQAHILNDETLSPDVSSPAEFIGIPVSWNEISGEYKQHAQINQIEPLAHLNDNSSKRGKGIDITPNRSTVWFILTITLTIVVNLSDYYYSRSQILCGTMLVNCFFPFSCTS